MRRALWVLAPILLLLAVIFQVAELQTLGRIFAGAHPGWLVAALLLQAGFALNQGAFYQAVFALLDTAVPLSTAVWLSLVMAFGSLATPMGTTAGMVIFVTAARDRGLPTSRAFLSSVGYYLFDYVAFLVVLLIGMLVLVSRRDLSPAELIVIGLFTLGVGTAGAVALRVLLAPAILSRLVVRVAAIVNRASGWVRRRPVFDRERVAEWVAELETVLGVVRRHPRRAARPMLHAFLLQCIGLGTLAVVFRAIGYAMHPGVLVAGYAVGTFFMVASITPSGVGVTEGAMIVTFTSLGVPLETAVAGALLFRLFGFWLPMLAGFLSLHMLPARATGPGGGS